MRNAPELMQLARVITDDLRRRTDHRRQLPPRRRQAGPLLRIRRRLGKRLIATGNRMAYGRRARTYPC